MPLKLISVHLPGDRTNLEIQGSNGRFVVVLKLVLDEVILLGGGVQLKRVEALL